MKTEIIPSMLACNFAKIEEECKKLDKCNISWLHLDIMDGHFVPNISFGMDIVSCIRKYSSLFLDVHLMISRPDLYYKRFIEAGAELITFHIEAEHKNTAELISKIKNENIKVGLSVKPGTGLEKIENYIKDIDLILIMTVEPGFGGQKFMSDMLGKITTARQIIDKINPSCILQVDGGISSSTIAKVHKAGATHFVAGSSVFGYENLEEGVQALEEKTANN